MENPMKQSDPVKERDTDDFKIERVKEEPLDPSEGCANIEQGDCIAVKDEADSCDDCCAKILDFEVPPEKGGGLISVQLDPFSDSKKPEFLNKKENEGKEERGSTGTVSASQESIPKKRSRSNVRKHSSGKRELTRKNAAGDRKPSVGNAKIDELMAVSVKRGQRQSKKPRISSEELAVSGDESNGVALEPAGGPSRKRRRMHDTPSRTAAVRSDAPNEVLWEYNPTTGMQKYRGIEIRPCYVKIPVMTKDVLASYGADLGEKGESMVNLKTLKRGLFSCVECTYRTNHKLVLARHLTKHMKKYKPFKCPQCEYRASHQCSLNQHIRRHHLKEQRFKCGLCDYSSPYSTGLIAHEISKHKTNRDFGCPYCDYKTKYERAVVSHLKTHTGERPFPCPHCPYRARQYPHLKSHVYVHLDVKPYACKECDYKTRQKSHLNQHMRLMHSDEKPLKCDYCDFTCKCSHTLVLHVRRHTGERPFACGLCPYRTAHGVLINKHKKEHDVRASHQCPYCSWSAVSQLSVDNHITKWHPDKCAYKCNKCDYASSVQTGLFYHKRKKHQILHVLRCSHCKFSSNKVFSYKHHMKGHEKK